MRRGTRHTAGTECVLAWIGQPPVISFRAAFDDMEYNRVHQWEHNPVKGRFQGGDLRWLDAKDMELFVCMCRKPLESFTFEQAEMPELIRRQRPMNIQQIRAVRFCTLWEKRNR